MGLRVFFFQVVAVIRWQQGRYWRSLPSSMIACLFTSYLFRQAVRLYLKVKILGPEYMLY